MSSVPMDFRFPPPFPGCQCSLCTRLGVTPEELLLMDNVPSVFSSFKLVKLEPASSVSASLPSPSLPATPSTNKRLNQMKIEIPLSSPEEYTQFEALNPGQALYNGPTQNWLWVKFLLRIIRSIKKMKTAAVFCAPVDLALVPDYSTVIAHPMDLGTIERKLATEPTEYSHPDQCVADVRLVFRNAYAYNRAESDIRQQAKALSQHFEQSLLQL